MAQHVPTTFEEVYDKIGLLLTENEDCLVKCVAAHIDPALAAFLLDRLGREDALPLERYGLGHLKRIRRFTSPIYNRQSGIPLIIPAGITNESIEKEERNLDKDSENSPLIVDNNKMIKKSKPVQILLVPETHNDDISSIFGSLVDLNEDMLTDKFLVSVAKYMPNYREEFDKWVPYWPINFRPSDADREREKGLPNEDIEIMRRHMIEVLLECDNLKEICGSDRGGVIVNPIGNKVI